MPHLEEAINTRAGSFAGLTALIGSRFFFQLLSQDADLPAVTYQRIDTEREHALGVDVDVARARVQFSAWAASDLAVLDVKEQLRLAFRRWRGTFAGVEILDSLIKAEVPLDYEPKSATYGVALDFWIFYRED